MVTNESALDCVEIVNKFQTKGCHLDVEYVRKDLEELDYSTDRLRFLFDLILSGYVKEVACKGFVRPMPPMFANDGQSLDLLKLFLIVRDIGGYDSVSKEGLWGFVVKELGLDFQVSASVKLIYAKYLYELEKWLRSDFGDRNGDCQDFGFLTLEQEETFRGLFTNGVDLGGVVNKGALMEYRKRIGKVYGDDVENVARRESSTRKRKRKCLSEMLSWVMQVAKCPDDPSVQDISEPSKWKDHVGDELWIQAIRAREALRQKRDGNSVIERSFLQNNQKMHPYMYEDDFVNHNFTERLRCNETLPRSISCCSSSTLDNQLMCLHRTLSDCGAKEHSSVATGISSLDTTSMIAELFEDDSFRRCVSIGPFSQAEVPEWTGPDSDSDPKWLGTRQWPVNDSLPVKIPIGSGRPNSCDCQVPDSIECIRFHIAEKRMILKLELGSMFYNWRFDCMGEEISLRWTPEEEKRFKHMVQLEPPTLNTFWPRAYEFFPRKTRQELVSYYFNVFVIQCRSYQNRVTPKSIDSDDDESEFGCISDSYGSCTLKFPSSNTQTRYQNNRCIGLN